MDKDLYLYLVIGEAGLNDVSVVLSDNKVDPSFYSESSGQALRFKYEDGDFSSSFKKAFDSGRFFNDLKRLYHKVKIQRRQYWQKGDMYGFSYAPANTHVFYDNTHEAWNPEWTEISSREFFQHSKILDRTSVAEESLMVNE